MKVQVIFNGSYPIGTVSTHRVHHICKGLVQNDVDLDLLIVHPTENADNIRNTNASGSFENVKYRYISNNVIRHKNIFLRKIKDIYFHFLVILEVFLNKNDNDIVIVIGPSLDFRTFLPMATFFNQSKIFLEINEYPFYNNFKSLKSRLKRKFWLNVIVPMYDGFIVISDELDQLISAYISKRANNINIPILGDFQDRLNDYTPILSTPYMIHAGSLFESKDGIMGILKAYKLFLDNDDIDLSFVITGNTKYSDFNKHVHHYINENNLSEKVIFTGFLSTEDMANYLRGSSFAIINKLDNVQNRYCFSTKLADYLKFQVPIIITNVGEAKMYLKHGVNAYVVEPNDTMSLVNAMRSLLNNSVKTKDFSQEGYKLIEKEFNHKYQGQVLKSFFLPMIDKERT